VSGDHLPLSLTLYDEQGVPVDAARLQEMARRVDAARIADLNAEFLGGTGPTDVLAFPVDGLVTNAGAGGPPVLIGEIVLCPEVALRQAPDGPDGLGAELDLLVAHGVLHLLGYDHDSEEAAASMRTREEAACGRPGARAT